MKALHYKNEKPAISRKLLRVVCMLIAGSALAAICLVLLGLVAWYKAKYGELDLVTMEPFV